MPDPLAWKKRAACRGLDVNLFYSTHSKKGLAVCAKCEVTEECFAYNNKMEKICGWRSGIWGNTTAAQRNAAEPLDSWKHSRIPHAEAY